MFLKNVTKYLSKMLCISAPPPGVYILVGGRKRLLGKKIKTEGVGNKMTKKGKGEKEKTH